jgi:hypothetical protein
MPRGFAGDLELEQIIGATVSNRKAHVPDEMDKI